MLEAYFATTSIRRNSYICNVFYFPHIFSLKQSETKINKKRMNTKKNQCLNQETSEGFQKLHLGRMKMQRRSRGCKGRFYLVHCWLFLGNYLKGKKAFGLCLSRESPALNAQARRRTHEQISLRLYPS